LVWAVLSVAGISALVAASEIAFAALKVFGAVVLIWIGVGALRRSRRAGEKPAENIQPARNPRRPFRAGLITSLANPKLAVFFVALSPNLSAVTPPCCPRPC